MPLGQFIGKLKIERICVVFEIKYLNKMGIKHLLESQEIIGV